METPTLSIVMPVFDTGDLLLAAVRSVLAQTLFAEEPAGYWELLIVDDSSTDAETLAALAQAGTMSPFVRLLKNARQKGVAGARNTGVFASRAAWVGFLDSDDLWYPDFLSRVRDAYATVPDARWRAAHFDAGDEDARVAKMPLKDRSPCLYRVIEGDYDAGRISRLHRPVDVLLRCGCMQVMTVQIRRELLTAMGGFNEHFICAEDYDLWLRLANVEDLFIAPIDAGIYRIRPGSLTKSDRPMYFGEDEMLLSAKADPAFVDFRPEIDARLVKVYEKFCFHFRATAKFADARRFAAKLIRLDPARPGGWRHLLAAALRR